METKVCTKCGVEYPRTKEFFYTHKNVKGFFRSECKKCHKKYMASRRDENLAYNAAYYKENRETLLAQKREMYKQDFEKILENGKAYRARNRDKIRVSRVCRFYGITEEQLVQLLDEQRGCCAICGDSLVTPESDKSYSIDHNHETGEVRGLLCNFCNTAIAFLKEDIKVLSSAIKYLRRYNG